MWRGQSGLVEAFVISFTVIHGNVECYLAAAVHSFLSGSVESGFEFQVFFCLTFVFNFVLIV